MKVISLIPSITETLIEAGVEVVGRTRFCIHPKEKVKNIAIVGGTKDIQWDKVKSLNPQFLILDKEENPKSFADESPFPCLVIHVVDVLSLARSLKLLAKELENSKLKNYGDRIEKLKPRFVPLDEFVDWVSPLEKNLKNIEYLIWRNPLMAVSQETYIGSVLLYLGHNLSKHEKKYPKISDTLEKNKIYLFSSEPYPFRKHRDWIKSQNISSALVNGEDFSWFGIRSLKFLEKHLST